METGYGTLDLAMLAIAAFVVWIAMRTQKKSTASEDLGANSKSQSPNGSTHSVTS